MYQGLLHPVLTSARCLKDCYTHCQHLSGLLTLTVSQLWSGVLVKLHSAQSANATAYYFSVGTFLALTGQGGHVRERVDKGFGVTVVE